MVVHKWGWFGVLFEIFSKSSWNEVVLISSINLQKSSKSSSYQKVSFFAIFPKSNIQKKSSRKWWRGWRYIGKKGWFWKKGKITFILWKKFTGKIIDGFYFRWLKYRIITIGISHQIPLNGASFDHVKFKRLLQ